MVGQIQARNLSHASCGRVQIASISQEIKPVKLVQPSIVQFRDYNVGIGLWCNSFGLMGSGFRCWGLGLSSGFIIRGQGSGVRGRGFPSLAEVGIPLMQGITFRNMISD